RHTSSKRDWSSDVCSSDLGSNYIINGEKRFIINAEIADVLLIAAQAKSSSGDPKGITLFLVPKDSPGIQEMRREKTMGLNELPRSEERRVGKEGRSRSARE